MAQALENEVRIFDLLSKAAQYEARGYDIIVKGLNLSLGVCRPPRHLFQRW